MSNRRIAATVLAVIGLALFILPIIASYGTGFGSYTTTTTTRNFPSGEVTDTAVITTGKTLWDWMELLLVPAVLALGALWFSRQERKAERENQEQRRQADREIQEQRAEIEREVAKDRQQENALQMYLDRMADLLLKEDLRKSNIDAEVRDVARARTLTVVRSLDAGRKGSIVRFLKESGLIEKENPVVLLEGADLSGAELNMADLRGANLSTANLIGAKLNVAWLSGANLRGANLSGAELYVADLGEADLSGVKLIGAKLNTANLSGAELLWADLGGATYDDRTSLPDGFDPAAAGAIKVED